MLWAKAHTGWRQPAVQGSAGSLRAGVVPRICTTKGLTGEVVGKCRTPWGVPHLRYALGVFLVMRRDAAQERVVETMRN